MQSKTCFRTLGLLLVAANLRAETLVTEAEFLAAIDGSHPAAIALRAPLGRAAAERATAAIVENPRLLFAREEPEAEPRETVWSVAWSPPLDGRFSLGIDAAEVGIQVADHQFAAELLALRREARRVYATWLLAESRHSLLTRHSRKLGDLASRMDQRAEVGEESLLDARRFELAATTVTASLANAEAELGLARRAAFVWNPDLPADSRTVLEALPEIPQGLEPWNRPDLLAKNSELAQARIQERLSRRFWSFPEVYAGWKTIAAEDVDLAGPVFGFDWQVPLFDRRQADRKQVTEELAAADAGLTWSRRQAAADLEVALQVYATLRQTIRDTRDVVAKTDEVLRMGGAAFAEGEYTTTDLLEIWGSVVTTQLALLDLESEALAAHREIETAVGQALPLGGKS